MAGNHYGEEIKKKAIELYLEGLSCKTIGRQLHIPQASIFRWVDEAGKMRPMTEAIKLRHPPTEETKRKTSMTLKGKYVGENNWNTIRISDTSKNPSEHLAYILGVMYGDGYFDARGIGLESRDRDFVEAFSNAVKIHFGIEGSIYNRPSRGALVDWRGYTKEYMRKPTFAYRSGSVLLRNFIVGMMKFENILNMTYEHKIAFLRGLWDSEGTIYIGHYMVLVNITHKDLELCKLFQRLLLETTGIESKITHAKSQNIYRCYWYHPENAVKFHDIVRPTIQRKRDKFEEARAELVLSKSETRNQ